MSGFLAGVCIAILPFLAAGFWLGRRTARPENLGGLGTPVEHATFETLHTASLAAPRCGPASPRRRPADPPADCARCSARTPCA